MPSTLSDKGLAVFAFAAYHQLTSGTTVTDVVLHDGAGHAADPEAIRELEAAGLAKVESERATFTDKGQITFGKILDAIRSADQLTSS